MTLVEKLVRSTSPSGQEKDAIELLVTELKARGFHASRDDAGNAVGVVGRGSTIVYLIGHIDTVTGELPVRVEKGKLYGRGSVDAKGSLAAFAEAAGKFTDSSTLTVTVIGCVGEEADSRGAHHVLANYESPDYAVIGEPSGWDSVTLGYRGSLSVSYSLERPRVHPGVPGPTPAEEAVAFYHGLRAAYPEHGVGFGKIALKLIDVNTFSSGTHESTRMRIDVRTPREFNLKDFEANVRELGGQAQVTCNGFIPAVIADKRNGLVRAFLGAIRVRGGRPRFKYKTGTSDMNLFSDWGCPILAYGPGDSSLDHTPDEHLRLDEYEHAIAVLSQALTRLPARHRSGGRSKN